MNTGFILYILIICLLSASIGYCFVLNRRLVFLRQSQEEFFKLIDRFDDATQRAGNNISRLRDVSAEVDESLDERITTARRLRDELNFLVERAAPAVHRPAARAASRGETPAMHLTMAPAPADSATPPGEPKRSVVESGLLEALREARRG